MGVKGEDTASLLRNVSGIVGRYQSRNSIKVDLAHLSTHTCVCACVFMKIYIYIYIGRQNMKKSFMQEREETNHTLYMNMHTQNSP